LQSADINKWLTLVANFGVIAGILFLAVEVRQNQESLNEANVISRLSASAATLEAYDGFRTMLIQDREIAQLWDSGLQGASLDPIDAQRFQRLCESHVWNLVVAYERYIAIGREDSAIDTAGQVRSNIEAYIGYRECWQIIENGIREVGCGFFIETVEGSN